MADPWLEELLMNRGVMVTLLIAIAGIVFAVGKKWGELGEKFNRYEQATKETQNELNRLKILLAKETALEFDIHVGDEEAD